MTAPLPLLQLVRAQPRPVDVVVCVELWAHLDTTEYRPVPHDLGDRVGLSRSTVYDALARLTRLGFLDQRGSHGARRWRLCTSQRTRSPQ